MRTQSNEIFYHTILLIFVVIVLAWISQFGLHTFTTFVESRLVQAASQR